MRALFAILLSVALPGAPGAAAVESAAAERMIALWMPASPPGGRRGEHAAPRQVQPGHHAGVAGAQDAQTSCGGCHADARDYGHPGGFVPVRALPAGYPLDARGRFTCTTCHVAPGRERPRGTCGDCHDADFFAAMADRGQSLDARAHLPVFRDASLSAADGLSVLCLDCHAGHGEYAGGAGAPGLRRTGAPGRAPANHPVGIPYARYVAYGGYVPVAALPEAVRLPDGRISCVTCHRVYGGRHGRTVLPTGRSQLCFACHDL